MGIQPPPEARPETPDADRLEFETLISDTSAALMLASENGVTAAIETAFGHVRTFFQADRCALLTVSADQLVVNVFVASYASGVSVVSEDINLAELFPWLYQRLFIDREPAVVPRIADLPPEATVDRASWEGMGLQSALAVPILTGSRTSHVIVIQAVAEARDWPIDYVPRLRVLGEMMACALQRMRAFEALRAAHDDVEARLRFETLIADLSSRFVNLPSGDLDREIEAALRRICELLAFDMAVLWQTSSQVTGVLTPTHFYCTQEGLRALKSLDQEQYPWYREQMLAGRLVAVASLEELPAEAAVDRESGRLRGILSNLCLPLSVGGEPPIGALSLSVLRAPRDWPDALVNRLQLVAQIFANALARKRSQLALEMSEELNRVTFEQAAVGIAHVGPDGRFLRVNDKLCSIVGYQHDELLKLTFQDITYPKDLETDLEFVRQLLAGEIETYTMEKRYIRKDRFVVWILLTVSLVRTADRTPKFFIAVVRDISERKRIEEALRQSYVEIEQLKDRLQAESDYLKAEMSVIHPHGEVTGRSAAIKKVLHLAERVAPTDSSVLVQGETGTGKELIAQAIHRLSPRGKALMIKVNCAALPSGLVESELFGREKGAFTGALTRQVGRFEVADGSTIFLDEIGELSTDVQAKLLRVLETGEFERLGSPRTIKVNVRLIAATNRDLSEAVKDGRFRADLYYRLNVFPIRVPPLRERAEDIPLLVWAFLEEFSSRMGKRITQVPRTTMDALQRHLWPGNVRELRNVVEYGAILANGDTLRVPMLEEVAVAAAVAAPSQTLADSDREHILRALEKTGWHVKGPNGAAAALGLNPATLYSRMKKLGIQPHQRTAAGSA